MKLSFVKFLIALIVFFSFSCNHGNRNNKPDGNQIVPPKVPKVPKAPKAPKDPKVKIFTVYEKDVKNNRVLIPTDKNEVRKANIKLEFEETDAPKEFKVLPESLTLEKEGDKGTIVVSTEATKDYNACSFTVTVIRSSGITGEKTIEECVAALESYISWNGTVTEKDITLPSTVAGFDDSSLVWKSSDEKVCSLNGEITRDLEDVEVTLTCEVSFKGNKMTTSFKLIVGRIKELSKKKDVNGSPYVYKLDFSTKGMLSISENGKEISKHEVSDINTKTKSVTLKLKETLDNVNGGNLITLEDLLSHRRAYSIKRTEALFGSAYKNLAKASAIEWDDFKKYVVGIDKAESSNASSNLDTDEKVFNYVKARYQSFGENWNSFKVLDVTQKTKAMKGFLGWIKTCYIYADMLNNISDENIFEYISKDRELADKYSVAKLGSSKVCKYVLVKTNELTTYPEGYKFLATAMYDSSKNWNEQNGDYYTGKSTSMAISTEVGHVRKDGKLVSSLYIENNGNSEPYMGIITGNEFVSYSQGAEILRATLNDTKDKKLTINITTEGSLKGKYELEFLPDTEGFKD
ncbi:MAG: immunoglobulin-like domain-containing protein [Treponema sp.]